MTKKTTKRGASPKISVPGLIPTLYGRDGQPLKLKPRSPAMRAVFGLLELVLNTYRHALIGDDNYLEAEEQERQVLVAAFLQADQVRPYDQVGNLVRDIVRVLTHEHASEELEAVEPLAHDLAEQLVEKVFQLRRQRLLDLLPTAKPAEPKAAARPAAKPAKAPKASKAKAPKEPPAKASKAKAPKPPEAPKEPPAKASKAKAPKPPAKPPAKPAKAPKVRAAPASTEERQPELFKPAPADEITAELLDRAIALVSSGPVAVSVIKSKLGVGYDKAKRIVEELKHHGHWPDSKTQQRKRGGDAAATVTPNEPKGFDPGAKDELYDRAVKIVQERGYLTTISDLAHELKVGRSRAAALAEAIDERGDWPPEPPGDAKADDDGFEAELGGAA